MRQIRTIFVLVVSYVLMNCSMASAQVPGIINYQGRIVANGTNFSGAGQFHFSLVDRGTELARQATATVVMGGVVPNQFVTQVNVVDGGNGYTIAPFVT